MQRKRILVVDDERHMRRLLQFTLEKTGSEVVLVGSGDEALQSLREGRFDLILLDLVMPGMDGFATAREIRRDPACNDVPIIMLTSRGQPEMREVATELGIASFFTKPFSPTVLIAEAKRRLASVRAG
jgi:CheY-like chemotaxis protein